VRRENSELREKLEAQQKEAFRQAAPFRIEDKRRKTAPRRPGRKDGHPGVCRRRPQSVDKTVEVRFDGCQKCGGEVTDQYAVEQLSKTCRQSVQG